MRYTIFSNTLSNLLCMLCMNAVYSCVCPRLHDMISQKMEKNNNFLANFEFLLASQRIRANNSLCIDGSLPRGRGRVYVKGEYIRAVTGNSKLDQIWRWECFNSSNCSQYQTSCPVNDIKVTRLRLCEYSKDKTLLDAICQRMEKIWISNFLLQMKCIFLYSLWPSVVHCRGLDWISITSFPRHDWS